MYSFTNTCAFDSVLQTLVVAAIDDPKVEISINNLRRTGNATLDLAMSIKKNGTQTAYWKRGVILTAIIEDLDLTKIHQTNRSINVDCEMNVCELAHRLFTELPKGKVSLKCNGDCPRREIELTYIFLPNALLHDSSSGSSIYNHLKGPENCSFCRHGIVEKTYEASGNSLQQKLLLL